MRIITKRLLTLVSFRKSNISLFTRSLTSESATIFPRPTKQIIANNLQQDIKRANLRGYTNRKVYIRNYLLNKAKMNPEIEQILGPLRLEVKEQGDLVRNLKARAAPNADIEAAVRLLKEKKRTLETKEASLVPREMFVDKTHLEDLLKQRFFYGPSFAIYGGVSGLYDYGPPGVALKKNILKIWEAHFVLEDDLLEIEASQLTPEPVLKASGHVERFADLMVKDLKTGECFRLDHLIENNLEKIKSSKSCSLENKHAIDKLLARLDGLSKEEMQATLSEYNIKSPTTGNDLSEPVEFNLMFGTSIGPTGLIKSFLRPETAQGIFVNFKKLLEANQGKLPFGVAQIGKSFRNEISPRGGLSRMREFTMCEIEYFVDPQNKKHAKYDSVKKTEVNLYSACNQMNGEPFGRMSLGDAVNQGIVANEILAYYLARIYSFMLKIGMDPVKIRFRQHMSNEMAHYATDCWDCELLTTSGWLECVGCADRSCYDLSQHAQATNTRLSANRMLDAPKTVEVLSCVVQSALIGKTFKGDAKLVGNKLMNAKNDEMALWESELANGMLNLNIEGKDFCLTNNMVEIKREMKTLQVEEVIPNVIEPSFGVDRIMYSLIEHNFKIRADNPSRRYFTFPAIVAPIKCSVLPLSNNEAFYPFVGQILTLLKNEGVRPKLDAGSESIGRRYVRTDEIGIPYGITVDFDTVKEKTVTLRECASLEQVRVDIESVAPLVRDLTTGKSTWIDAKKHWPEFTGQNEP